MARRGKGKFELPKKEDGEPVHYKAVGNPAVIVEENATAVCCGQQMRVYCSQARDGVRIRYWQCMLCKRTTKTAQSISER